MQDIVREVLKHRSVFVVLVSCTDAPPRVVAVSYSYDGACAALLREAVREMDFSFYDPLRRFRQSRNMRWSSREDGHVFWEDCWAVFNGIGQYTIEEWVPDSQQEKIVTHCTLDRYVKGMVSSGQVTREELAQRIARWKVWASSKKDSASSFPELASTLSSTQDTSHVAYVGHAAWKLMWAAAARDPFIPEADRKLSLW